MASALLVSTTLLSTTSKRKMIPLQSNELKGSLRGGISLYLSCYSCDPLLTSRVSQVFPNQALMTIDSNDSCKKLQAQCACAAELLK